LGQVVPCLVITGCSQNHNGTKPETVLTTDRATVVRENTARDQEIAEANEAVVVATTARDAAVAEANEAVTNANTVRDAAVTWANEEVAKANTARDAAIARVNTEKEAAIARANEAVTNANTEKDEAVARANTEKEEAVVIAHTAREELAAIARENTARDQAIAEANEAVTNATTEKDAAAIKIQATVRGRLVRKVAVATEAVTESQVVIRGNRTQKKVISQQNATLLAGVAAWGGYVTNSLFTWQSASKQQEKYVQEYQKLANNIRTREEALLLRAMIDFDTTSIRQKSDATCVSDTRLLVSPSVSASQAVPVGMCTLLAGRYLAKKIQCYRTALAAVVVATTARDAAVTRANESVARENEAVTNANTARDAALARANTEKEEAVVIAHTAREELAAIARKNTEIDQEIAEANEAVTNATTKRDAASIEIQATVRDRLVRKVAVVTEVVTDSQVVISQQNATLLAGAAAWGGDATNGLFTWQSASKQQEKQAQEYQKLANNIRIREEALLLPAMIDVNTTPISQVNDAACVSVTRSFVSPSVSVSQALPVGLSSSEDEYIVRKKLYYETVSETAVAAASCGAIVQGNTEKDAAVAPKCIQKLAKKRLDSSDMRYVITTLVGVSQSQDTFDSGGVCKNNFFSKNDSASGQKTYISLAHDEKGTDIQRTQCGERSISEVLAEIKKLIHDQVKDSIQNSQILILLQQLKKAHWTLLEINTNPLSAKNHDSKAFISFSRMVDWWDKELAVECAVKKEFEVIMEYKYSGTQRIQDHHNCGRYALMRLQDLIGLTTLDESKKGLEGINQILCGQKCSQIQTHIDTDDSASDDEDSFH
jgi:IQ calmodulin-binding motif